MDKQVADAYASPNVGGSSQAQLTNAEASSTVLALFSDRQIGYSAFLATPLAGALMFSYNASKLGRTGTAMGSMVVYFVVTIILLLAGQILPFGLGQLLLLAIAFSMKKFAAREFADDLLVRQVTGDGWMSNWTALGVSIVVILFLAVPFLALVIASS